MARPIYPWIFPVAIFAALDVLTTFLVLQNEYAYEANPLMAPFVNNVLTFVMIKAVVILIIFFIAWAAESRYKNAGFIIIGVASFITCTAAIWNIMVYLTLSL